MKASQDFLGVYYHELDNKNRLVVPSQWRKTIRERNDHDSNRVVYFTYGQLHSLLPCIEGYDARQYEKARENIPGYMWYRKTMDAQHRIGLPDPLIEHSRHSEGEAFVMESTGDKSHIRIWGEKTWKIWELYRNHPGCNNCDK